MNMKTALLGLGLAGLATLAGCSSPSVITTTDGEKIMTADQPETDSDDGFVEYEQNGQEKRVNRSEVRSIEEVK
jgi:hypothetical protein